MINGTDRQAATYRAFAGPGRILFADQAKWLTPVTNSEARDLQKIDEKDTLLWGAKVIYTKPYWYPLELLIRLASSTERAPEHSPVSSRAGNAELSPSSSSCSSIAS
jgi:hypothetical protein